MLHVCCTLFKFARTRPENDAQVAVPILGGLQMSDDAPRWASFSSAFSIVLSLASDRIAELGCAPIGDDPQAFVDGGGLRRLETEAADAAIRRVRGRPIRSFLSCLVPKCLAAKSASLF